MLTIATLLRAWVGSRSVNSCAPLIEARQSTLVRWLSGGIPSGTRIPAIARGTGYSEDELVAVCSIEGRARSEGWALGVVLNVEQIASGALAYDVECFYDVTGPARAVDCRSLTVPEILVGDVVGMPCVGEPIPRIVYVASDFRAPLARQRARIAAAEAAASVLIAATAADSKDA